MSDKNKDKYIIMPELFCGSPAVSIKNYGDEFNPWWGWESIELSKEDCEALLAGKILETSVAGEYGVLIRMKDNDPSTGD